MSADEFIAVNDAVDELMIEDELAAQVVNARQDWAGLVRISDAVGQAVPGLTGTLDPDAEK